MDKVGEDWNGLQFYILLGRRICWTQSSDFVIHTNKDPLNELGNREKKGGEEKCILLALPKKDFESLTGINFKQFIVISLGVLSTMTLAW